MIIFDFYLKILYNFLIDIKEIYMLAKIGETCCWKCWGEETKNWGNIVKVKQNNNYIVKDSFGELWIIPEDELIIVKK